MSQLRIKAIGFELEGEFSPAAYRLLDNGRLGNMVGDGSLHPCRFTASYSKNHAARLDDNEFVSRVFRVGFAHDEEMIEDFFKTLQRLRAAKEYHWNKSMGFHVHVSFNRMPMEIWSKPFYDFFYIALASSFRGVLTRRAANRYCRMTAERPNESIAHSNTRYMGINFEESYREHGTIEFRIFPAAAPRTLKRYLSFTLSTVEAFIRQANRLLRDSIEEELQDHAEIEERVQAVYGEAFQPRADYDETTRLNQLSVIQREEVHEYV